MIAKNLSKKVLTIYAILNLVNGKIYIGKTKSLYHRCYQYLYSIKHRKTDHVNSYLLNSFIKHGVEKFKMFAIETCCDEKVLAERELFWMDFYNSTDRNFGYNLRQDSSSGMVTHPETGKKISARLKKEWASGIRQNHSSKLKEVWRKSPERRINQGAFFSKVKTKYSYVITKGDCEIVGDYSTLKSMNLSHVISNFYRKKSDEVMIKGYKIRRVFIGPQI